jgi:hypothetical protein
VFFHELTEKELEPLVADVKKDIEKEAEQQ